jgi:hypothetical protein
MTSAPTEITDILINVRLHSPPLDPLPLLPLPAVRFKGNALVIHLWFLLEERTLRTRLRLV